KGFLVDRLRDDLSDGRNAFRHRCSPCNRHQRAKRRKGTPVSAWRTRGHWLIPPCVRVMILELTDEQSEALARLLSATIDGDRYPIPRRTRPLKKIGAKTRRGPAPAAEPPLPLRSYAPPTMGRFKRRR